MRRHDSTSTGIKPEEKKVVGTLRRLLASSLAASLPEYKHWGTLNSGYRQLHCNRKNYAALHICVPSLLGFCTASTAAFLYTRSTWISTVPWQSRAVSRVGI